MIEFIAMIHQKKNSFTKTLWMLFTTTSLKFRRRLFGILSLLLFLTAFVWIATLAFSSAYPTLLGLVMLAYGFGLSLIHI